MKERYDVVDAGGSINLSARDGDLTSLITLHLQTSRSVQESPHTATTCQVKKSKTSGSSATGTQTRFAAQNAVADTRASSSLIWKPPPHYGTSRSHDKNSTTSMLMNCS